MNTIAILLATGISLASLGWIRATDPKRRRSFGVPDHEGKRHARLAWTAVVVPGALTPLFSGASGMVVWLGAVSFLGWVLAATRPGAISRR